jgi:hypothetical protein
MKNILSFILCAFFMLFNASGIEAYMMHQKNIEQEWKEENLLPFDELMLSWNAARPTEGRYLFYVSVKIDTWSPWLLYASWGSDGQASFLSTTQEAPIRAYQDAVEVLEEKKATGFQIKIVSEGLAPLDALYSLHVYMNSDKTQEPEQTMAYTQPIFLEIGGLSQMVLTHMRYADFCSPTSTAAVTRYLAGNTAIDPVDFAQHVWDSGFDIFGNWVFNVAQASAELGPAWSCWVERLKGFDDIYQRLAEGTPVIVSVRGPLPGSAKPYVKGHLMAVIGFDPLQQTVVCMDPAFPSDFDTLTDYNLSDFVQAWNRRGRVAYVFNRD